ncbi:helix-turn-helix domain-containing protein [Paraburkholderia sp. BCC1886]|uniref:helix-turn-helix domain-containing protein n=1 Tax=Paraburkholderia sp. BCC1886 TaxID=2562670 RepID=UPI00118333D0|nr:helix-turn-helix domain-containing protein [Paraburkholderia sp. BCC1886]
MTISTSNRASPLHDDFQTPDEESDESLPEAKSAAQPDRRLAAAAFSRHASGPGYRAPAARALPSGGAGSGARTVAILSRPTLSSAAPSAAGTTAPPAPAAATAPSGPTAPGGPTAASAPTNPAAPTAPTGSEPSDTLPGITIGEFAELNRLFDTRDGYNHHSSINNTSIATRMANGLEQQMTGYPPEVIRFQQKVLELQGMLVDLPLNERQFYGGVMSVLGIAYQLETRSDQRFAIGQKLAGVERAIYDESARVRNDPVDRALSIFNPPMGEGCLNKIDRQRVDQLELLREEFFEAGDAGERKVIFDEAAQLRGLLHGKINIELTRSLQAEQREWREANTEVDRILKEAEGQTDVAKRYELIGRQLFQIDPGQDRLKDKVVLAFTERMRRSPEVRQKLDTWHDQVSGPLNAHSVGTVRRYTDILKSLPPVSGDYVRDLSDQYTHILKDASEKNYSITPEARALKLSGQIMEGIMRVMLEMTPLGILSDSIPSTLPAGWRMGIGYGGMLLDPLLGTGVGKQVARGVKALVSVAKRAEIDNLTGSGVRTAGKGLVQSASEQFVKSALDDSSLSQQAKAAAAALEKKMLAETGPMVDPISQVAHDAAGVNSYGSLAAYADPDVQLTGLRAGTQPGILEDVKGDRFIGLEGKAYHVRFDRDSDTWRVFMKGADLKPQYPVRFNERTNTWELHGDVGLAGGIPRISSAVRLEAVRLLNEGEWSRKKIAEHLGISKSTVNIIAREENIAPNSMHRLKVTPATRQEVVKLLKENVLTRAEIAERFDISAVTVRKIARDNGIALKISPIRPEVRQETIRLLRENKWSDVEIAKKVGISRSSVFEIRHELKMPAFRNVGPKNLTPELRRDIIQKLKNGESYEAIATPLQLSKSSVMRIARQENIVRRIPVDITPEQIDQIFALRGEGKSISEVASLLKLPEHKVKDVFANYDSVAYKWYWWHTTPQKRTTVIQQLDQGKAAKDIAKDLNLPLETVRGIANHHRIARDSLACELLAQGKSPEEVATSLGITTDYVRRLAADVPRGQHGIHLDSEQGAVAMEMFQKGYSRQDVATRLGISPWKAHSLSNEFRTKIMDSVTPRQLTDLVRALNDTDRSFTTGELARGTGLSESTVTVVEHEYQNGFIRTHPVSAQSPQAGPSWAEVSQGNPYEWVRPLTLDQEIQAIRGIDDGQSLHDVAGELGRDFAAIERLYEEDLPMIALADDPELPLVYEPVVPVRAPTVATFSAADKAEIRALSSNDRLSASFIANLFDTTEEEIKKILL